MAIISVVKVDIYIMRYNIAMVLYADDMISTSIFVGLRFRSGNYLDRIGQFFRSLRYTSGGTKVPARRLHSPPPQRPQSWGCCRFLFLCLWMMLVMGYIRH